MDGWNIAGVTRWSLSRCRCEQEGLIMHVCVVVTSIVNLDLHVPLQACGLWQKLKRVHAWAQVYVLCILGFIHALVYASLQCVCVHMKQRDDCHLSAEPLWQVFPHLPDHLLKLKRQSKCDAGHHFVVRPVVYISVKTPLTCLSLSYCRPGLVPKFLFLYGCCIVALVLHV